MTEFAMKLYSVRIVLNMSQYAFAKKMGISRVSYHHYEDGTRTPNVDFLKKLCEVYNVDPVWMLGLDSNGYGVVNVTNKKTHKAISKIESALAVCAEELSALKVVYGEV